MGGGARTPDVSAAGVVPTSADRCAVVRTAPRPPHVEVSACGPSGGAGSSSHDAHASSRATSCVPPSGPPPYPVSLILVASWAGAASLIFLPMPAGIGSHDAFFAHLRHFIGVVLAPAQPSTRNWSLKQGMVAG